MANRPSRGRGFTLIEMMVVLMLIGLAALMIIPNIAPSDNARRVQKEAQRLAIIIDALRQESILKFQNFVMQIFPNHYQVLLIDPLSGPQPIDDKPFSPRQLPDDMYFKVNVDNENISLASLTKPEVDENGKPAAEEGKEEEKPDLNIIIYASGEQSPFSLKLISENGQEYELTGEINGKIAIAKKEF